MATERDRSADPAQVLALLWRDPDADAPRKGPRQGLAIDEVVAAAIDLADAEGIDAVTMRRVARVLGVAPMTLYTYVPGKAALLDLMLDAVYATMPRTCTEGLPWRDRLAAVAADNWALFAAHPWAATASPSRPPLGPGQMAKYEHELRALDDTGLDDVERDAALTFLLGFVQSCARAAAEARAMRRDSAMSDEQWWAAHEPVLQRVFDPAEYPTAARVGAAAGAALGGAFDANHAYEFGIARVLDGLGALIAPQ